MSNIVGIHDGCVIAMEPNPQLITNIRALLELAESGQMQSFIGTGFTRDGLRVATWGDFHSNVYEMLGALAWLQVEYTERHPGSA